MMYNKNICFHYIREYIMTTNILLYMEVYIMSYMKMCFLLYKTMYNKNICFHYIRLCIMKTNIFIIHGSVYHVIHENVFLIIQDDV